MQSINPATGKVLHSYPETSDADLSDILTHAGQAAQDWAQSTFATRVGHMRRLASLLRERASVYAKLMAAEMGKPLPQGRAEVDKCAWACDFYADRAEPFLAPESVQVQGARTCVAFRPLGVVLAIMPWNFPFWQVFRFATANLMAGNGALLKHAPNVQGCAQAIEEVVRDAGFPRHLLRNIATSNERTAAVIQHPVVQAVTLTGSTRAGRAVAAIAGVALKKTVLELGGSDPYIVLSDAAVSSAAETCVASRLINGGQSCIAAKRFIVVRPVLQEFTEQVVALMGAAVHGDPLGVRPVDLGPMARHDLRDTLHDQVSGSVKAGAKLLLGGQIPDHPGAFYPPTVLTDVQKGMPAGDEETFGPVACILPVRDEDEAFRVANDSPYGLGAAIFTADVERIEKLAIERLEAGSCFVNDFVKSDPRLPFGGIKQSGYGRELSIYGIREFVNVKSIYAKT